jgi:hypothetical protein
MRQGPLIVAETNSRFQFPQCGLVIRNQSHFMLDGCHSNQQVKFVVYRFA